HLPRVGIVAEAGQVIRSCFSSTGGEGCKNRRGGDTALPTAGIDDITRFLSGSVRLRLNDISGRIEYFDTENSDDGGESWKPFTDRILNTLWADMSHSFRVRKDDINNVVNSSHTPHFNPIIHYLESLPRWKEGDHDHIADLAATVRVRAGGTLPFYDVLKKWLVAMIASWVGSTTVNHVILVLIGEQGAY
ncbi:virulence protein E, partial [Parabacteroides distasonis]